MTDRTRRGLEVLQAALIMGVAGDALLRATPWGLNLLLWILLSVAAALMLIARWRRNLLTGEGRWILIPLIFFAACFVWRDSLVLKLLDAVAIFLALALAILRTRAVTVRLASIKEYLSSLFASFFDSVVGLPTLLLCELDWREIPQARWSRYVGSMLRGLLIAAPLILLFGALLMTADAVFEGMVNNALNLRPEIILSHLGLITFFAWIAGGYLYGLLDNRDAIVANSYDSSLLSLRLNDESDAGQNTKADSDKVDAPLKHRRLSLSIVEIGIVLGLLDLLFLLFVTVQIRYFFGGASLVQQSVGLTYAEYARRGFFELVWVAGLVLPVLLAAHWLLRKENPLHERIFRVLAGAQVALLFVIMASAVERMRLYQSEYGLTELRFYTMAFMAWLAAVFLWFAWTVLRGARERFATGALIAIFVIVALLHLINPDATIVRVNVAHADRQGRSLDAAYVAGLSADAVPALAASLPAMNTDARCTVSHTLLRRWPLEASADWRTWNLSRREARRIVRENAAALTALWCTERDTGALSED